MTRLHYLMMELHGTLRNATSNYTLFFWQSYFVEYVQKREKISYIYHIC
jgi:hypothetical protein